MEEYDVESILDMYEESYVPEPSAMAQGGRIPFAKAKSVQKKYQPSGEDLTEAQIEGYAKRFNAAKAAKETNFKNLVDKIFDTEDFENFKAKPTESQLRAAKKAGKFRAGTGIIPAQYIKEFNQAMAAGVDSPEFKNLLRITGRTEEEILKLNELRPGGKVFTKVRADAAAKSYPKDRKVSEEEKIESEKRTEALKAARMPWFCPKCDKVMKKNIDDKMWRLYGHCSNCQVEFENRLAIDGKYDEWVKSVERENKLAWIRDQRETINEFKKQDTVEFFQQIRPDGYSLDTEKWEIDTSKIMKQADEYLEYLQKMEDTLQNE